MGLMLLVCCIGLQANANVVVYEGFDYATGSAIAGQGAAADGWSGAWTTAGSNPAVIIAGQTYGPLPVCGGAAQRPVRTGDSAMSRTISSAAQAALTADGTTLWFSVLMAPHTTSVFSYATNSYGTLILGDTALTGGGTGTAPPQIGAGGNAIGVGFVGGLGPDWNNMRIQGVTYKGGTLTQNTAERTFVGNVLFMVAGKIDWAANGSDDLVSLYLIEDSTAALPAAPFSTMAVDLDQTTFSVVSIGDAQASVFDEIRFGASFAEVTYNPTPANGDIVNTANPFTLSWVNLEPTEPTDSVYVDVWFGTEPNELSANYDMAKIIDAATTGQDLTSVDVNASVQRTYYWWVDTYVNGADDINDPNRIAGPLYSFVALYDTPPSVVIDTLDQMTWSGEGVPLQATVTDDGVSTVTFAWTADAVSMADPNLTIAIANGATSTPTVTITKDTEGLGLRTVTMTVSATDAANPTVTDSVEIDVYDTACQMARLAEGKVAIEGAAYITDFNDDCITNINDLLEMATVWLGDYSSPGPAGL
jgi:hypothetical protein